MSADRKKKSRIPEIIDHNIIMAVTSDHYSKRFSKASTRDLLDMKWELLKAGCEIVIEKSVIPIGVILCGHLMAQSPSHVRIWF